MVCTNKASWKIPRHVINKPGIPSIRYWCKSMSCILYISWGQTYHWIFIRTTAHWICWLMSYLFPVLDCTQETWQTAQLSAFAKIVSLSKFWRNGVSAIFPVHGMATKFLLNFLSFISNQSDGPGESDVTVNVLTWQSHIRKFIIRYLHSSESHQ